MSVTEYVQKPGSWDVQLSPETPPSLLDRIKVEMYGFAQLVVTPAHVNPLDQSDATMLTAARFVGIYRRQTGRLRLSGASLNILLGDEDGKGDIFENPRTTANGFFSEWIPALTPTALTTGTVTSPGGVYVASFIRVTAREALETLNARFGTEWRVTNDFKLEAGTATALYGSTPKAVILRNAGGGGRDVNLTGVEGGAVLDVDVEDYFRKSVLLTGSTDSPTQTVVFTSTPFFDPQGGPVVMDKAERSNAEADQSAIAATLVAAGSQVRRSVSVAADQYDIGVVAPVGSPVFLYDPIAGLYDGGNPVEFRGQTIYPVSTRVLGYRFPIQAGCGVYLRRKPGPSAAPEYIDLTPYVEFESGDVQVEVGALPRPSR